MDDHCGTVTPVVSLPHDSVMVLVSKPLPMAFRTGGNASSPMPADAPAATMHLILVPKDVVFLGKQVRHRVAGRHVGQKPE